jgi:hypothetical protein
LIFADTVCKKKWQDVQGTTKKKEAATCRRANACATGGGPPPVCNLRNLNYLILKLDMLESLLWQECMYFTILFYISSTDSEIAFH